MRDLEARHPFSCRRSIRHAQASFATVETRRYDRRTPLVSPAVVDPLLAVAWVALVAGGCWQTPRDPASRAALPPVVLQAWQPSIAAGLAVVAPTLAGALVLERLTGRSAFQPLAALVGLALVVPGVLLHGWARRTLGPMWSGVGQVR